MVQPPSGEEFNPGEVTEARQAASLIVLRDSPEGPEVLLVQRNPEQRFMGGAWVFPGGAVTPGGHRPRRHGRARARGGGRHRAPGADIELVPFSRWITPEEVEGPLRHLVLRRARRLPAPRPRRTAASASTPAGFARRRRSRRTRSDELVLVFPTIKHLEAALRACDPSRRRSRQARAREVEPVQPKVVRPRRQRAGPAARRARLRRRLAPQPQAPLPVVDTSDEALHS